MPNLVIITAPNLMFGNAGMASVDLASKSIVKALGIDAKVSWLTLHKHDSEPLRSYIKAQEIPISYELLQDNLEQVYKADAVIIWGDFLQARHYIVQDGVERMLKLKLAEDRAYAKRFIIRHILLSEAPIETIKRTFVYGGTVIHNSEYDYLDNVYSSAFTRLVQNARSIWMREPISAAKVSMLRKDSHRSCLGADAAFFLKEEELKTFSTSDWLTQNDKSKKIGIFVGARTPTPEGFSSFLDILKNKMDLEIEWLPWLVTRKSQLEKLPPELLSLKPMRQSNQASLGDLFAAIKLYKFIVTDTYHLAINAWRCGTPAICIGQPEPSREKGAPLSLNDLKKQVLYNTYDASDFYLIGQDFEFGEFENTAHRVVSLLQKGCAERIAKRMKNHADRIESELISELKAHFT